MQHMLRTICKSRAYQLSIVTNKWNEDDDINYSHAIARRLPAEVLYDAIQRATGSVSHLPGVPAGYRAAQLPDVGLTLPSGFFELFGRPARESSCECERSSGMMLGPGDDAGQRPDDRRAIADPAQRDRQAGGRSEPTTPRWSTSCSCGFCRVPPRRPRSKPAWKPCTPAPAKSTKLQSRVDRSTKTTLDAKQAAWEASQAGPTWTTLEPAT